MTIILSLPMNSIAPVLHGRCPHEGPHKDLTNGSELGRFDIVLASRKPERFSDVQIISDHDSNSSKSRVEANIYTGINGHPQGVGAGGGTQRARGLMNMVKATFRLAERIIGTIISTT